MTDRVILDIKTCGRRMREIRINRNLSVEEVAEFIFATKQAVYKWEKGLNYPQADKMISLAMLYGVNPIAFFMEEGDEPSSFDVMGFVNHLLIYEIRRAS